MTDRPTDLVVEIVAGLILCGLVAAFVALFRAYPLAVVASLGIPLAAIGIMVVLRWRGSRWSLMRFGLIAAAVGALVGLNILVYCDCL